MAHIQNLLERHLRMEGRQCYEEGKDRPTVEAIVDAALADPSEERLEAAYKELAELPLRKDWTYDEPSDLASIEKAAPGFSQPEAGLASHDLSDQMLGAWLGRCAGCALGKPVERGEFMNGNDKGRGWELMRVYLKGAGAWPLDSWVPDAGEIEGMRVGCPDSTRGRISFMETDDDIRYTVIGLVVLERFGHSFTTRDVAATWLDMLPIGMTFTAERESYRNIIQVFDTLDLNDQEILHWVRSTHNPFREWIGAQIRADGWGYGAAGRPALGARFGYRDAALTHVKNGIYGEMLYSAAAAAGFVSSSTVQALETAATFIPKRSRLAEAIGEAVALGRAAGDLDELHAELWKRWGHYDGVHTINNAALVAAALAYGGDDFEKTIVAAVTGGWDTDCNGATAGSIWGAVYGAKAIPDKWTKDLNDTLYAAIPGFHPISISECARRSVLTAQGTI